MSETYEEEEARIRCLQQACNSAPWPPPSNKSPEMDQLLDRLALSRGFDRERTCATCSSTKIGPDDFTDALSRKEYGISRMCQACQSKVFG